MKDPAKPVDRGRKGKIRKGLVRQQGGKVPLDVWRVLFDPEKTTIEEFLGLWKIRTESSGGSAMFVQFRLFKWQRVLLDRCLAAWGEGRSYRVRIPKARRRGVSAFWRAFLGFERILRVPGYEHTITAQSKNDAEEHLQYLREFYEQVPEYVLNGLGIKRVRSNASTFAFKHGGFRISRVRVKTASARGLGRGGQNNSIHSTERPHYPPRAKRDMNTSLLPNCADVAGNAIVDESTAMGYDEFWDDCKAARDKVSEYELFFLPAMGRDLNYRALRNDEERASLAASCGTLPKFGGEGEEQARQRTLRFWLSEKGASQEEAEEKSWEYIKWRRWNIIEECKSVSAHKREHPQFLEEAFQGTGRMVFPEEVVTSWLDVTSNAWEGAQPGSLRIKDKDVIFDPRWDGLLTMIEPPEPDGHYVIGSDVASGHRRIAAGSKEEEADYSTAVVLETYSGREIAYVRGHIYPRPFADVLVLLSVFYGGAPMFIEVNIDTVVGHILEMDYTLSGHDPAELLLTSERKVRTETGMTTQTRFGWYTSANTKKWLISTGEQFMREWGSKAPPVDPVTAEELMRFVYDDRGRSASAESGHDDMVMAWLIAQQARLEVMGSGGVPLMSKVKPPPMDPFLRQFSEQFRREKERELAQPLQYRHPMTGEWVQHETVKRGRMWRGF